MQFNTRQRQYNTRQDNTRQRTYKYKDKYNDMTRQHKTIQD